MKFCNLAHFYLVVKFAADKVGLIILHILVLYVNENLSFYFAVFFPKIDDFIKD